MSDEPLSAPYNAKLSWDGDHAMYLLTFSDGEGGERNLFLTEEVVDLMFAGLPEHQEGYTLRELVYRCMLDSAELDDEADAMMGDIPMDTADRSPAFFAKMGAKVAEQLNEVYQLTQMDPDETRRAYEAEARKEAERVRRYEEMVGEDDEDDEEFGPDSAR
jgi:hypothetical protein